MASRTRVVVVGGGITGLAAAHTLAQADPRPAVTLLEADQRLGGKIDGGPFAGLPAVDSGADMFLVRTPAAADLAAALGMAGDLVAPEPVPAHVWSGGRLHRLPPGLVLGAPAELGPMARSGLLSWRGKARAALEPLLPRRAGGPDDDNLGATIRARFGDEVLERLVGPLVGGINAGDADQLSLRAVTPQLAEAMGHHRSLLLGLRAQAAARPVGVPSGAPFRAPRSGVASMVARLAADVGTAGVDVRCGAAAGALETRSGGRWSVLTESGERLDADAVVLAVPARAAGRLLSPLSGEAADLLETVRYASVAIITLAFPDQAVAGAPAGSGYLVPRREQTTITACSWGSSKWPQWRRPGQVVLRVSAGRAGDERALDLDDAALTEAVVADLERQMGVRGAPTAVRVTRWWEAMPQYAPGHLARIERLMAALARDTPGLHVAGAAYRGLGLPACITQGQAAARAALATSGRS